MDWQWLIPIYLIMGVAVSSYGTLIGAGGGFLLVPVLLIFFGYSAVEAVGTSLVVVFINAISGTISYSRQKRIDFYTAVSFAVATIPGSILGGFLTVFLKGRPFDITFSLLLIGISIYLFLGGRNSVIEAANKHRAGVTNVSATYPLKAENGFFSPRRTISRFIVDKKQQEFKYRYNFWLGIIISFVIGFISSITGIGGGVIHVPVMISLLLFPPHVAVATSQAILLVSTFFGATTHLLQGHTLWTAIPLGIGAFIGAQFGAFLSQKLKGQLIISLLAVALMLAAGRLLYGALFL
jgi:uncharacterized protein